MGSANILRFYMSKDNGSPFLLLLYFLEEEQSLESHSWLHPTPLKGKTSPMAACDVCQSVFSIGSTESPTFFSSFCAVGSVETSFPGQCALEGQALALWDILMGKVGTWCSQAGLL